MLTHDQINRYRTDGFIAVPAVFDERFVRRMQDTVDKLRGAMQLIGEFVGSMCIRRSLSTRSPGAPCFAPCKAKATLMAAALLLPVLAMPRIAFGQERFVGQGVEVRTFLYFKVSMPALQKFVPTGWEINPAGSGPAAGANLLAAFLDQTTSLDAASKPLRPLRAVLFEIPVRQVGSESTAMVLFTGLSNGGPGTYSTNLMATAEVERKIRHQASPSASLVDESWDLKADGGETVSLELQFFRGPVAVQQVESRVYSQVRPQFSRIYRVEQGVDVVRSPSEAGRLKKVAFKAVGEKLTPLFDGTEQLISIVSVPVYARRIFLPGS